MQPTALLVTGLVAGLVAGTASCTAVQGGLLIGLLTRPSDGNPGSPHPVHTTCQRPDAERQAPVAWFLAGRLAAYSVTGALLGLLGSAVRLPPTLRAVLLVAAGVAVIAYALNLLRRDRPACAPNDLPDEPHSPGGVGRASLLGAATILVPCGVTLGMEMVAVSSASAVGGAAVMAGFVAGTAPAFAVLGYVLRKVARTRLVKVAAAVAVAAGVWTVGAGLNLGGWLPTPPLPASAAATVTKPGRPAPQATTSGRTATAGVGAPAGQTVTIWATSEGYRPGAVMARAGVPVEVVFKLVNQGCTRTVTIAGQDLALPATVRLPPQRPGILRYVCGMGMYSGFINFS
ncbi:sulfite exporter TauE/SafE family protein [Nonomuraea sp. NPDC000554]|uniref:sulfite exporter TauE/SafE family protein n=1 Tax=Nonomuraea sp. NPDC000554 TaxID=3154259 RepID=UPI003332D8A2